MAAPKMTKNQMRRAKKKEQKKAQANGVSTPAETQDETPKDDATPAPEETKNEDQTSENLEVKKDPDVDTNMDADGPIIDDIPEDDPAFAEYKRLLQDKNFSMSLEENGTTGDANGGNKGEVFYDQDDEIPSEDEEAEPKLSKKKRKKLNKLSIAELKALVANPEVVEWQDVSSSDPRLLVQIKAQRNIVPVPTHWSLKREYLSSKRGIEKPPFKLPKFIAETGITEMRDAVLEKQAEQTLKQKQRERVQPKMGKLDIDYQKLYDAFFRHQTKPDLTRFGDVYYEGKEWEADYKIFKAGDLSDALREALGMQPGFPPPWLLQQQRIGPPPSYPTLKIPGLNAPIPPGAAWGFQPGQWGKPPLDEYNRPLYGGDIFGIMAGQPGYPGTQLAAGVAQAAGVTGGYIPALAEPIERNLWGELQPPAEESEEEESEEEEEEEEDSDADDVPPGHRGTDTTSGLETPGGYASTINPSDSISGVETSMAGEFDLRKTRRGYETEESAYPRQAYTVIPERQTRVEGFFGSDKTYDLSGKPVLGQEDDTRKRKKPGDVDVAINPDELAGLSKEEIKKKYEQGRREEGGMGAQWNKQGFEEDLSDMIAQESRKRQRRDEERREARRR